MPSTSRDIELTGIIIKKVAYRETSIILDVFSPSHGMIAIMAKGVRSAKSKATGLLEILNELDLSVYKNPSSEWFIYRSSDLIKAHLFDTSFKTSCLMQAAAELVRNLIFSEEEAAMIYDLLQKYLNYLPEVKRNQIAIFWRFLVNLYSKLGINLDLTNCAICAQKSDLIAYYPQKHGFICDSCYKPVFEDYILRIGNEATNLIRNLHQIGTMLADISISKTAEKQINHLLLTHLSEHFHKRFYLKSLELY